MDEWLADVNTCPNCEQACPDCEQTAFLPQDPMDLLTEEQRQSLHDDLAEMARLRRRAEVESRGLSLG